MRKAKTNKKIFAIFSAILGVVFAFLTGFTYCATSLTLLYGTNANSTSAYMGNQQFHVINDTATNPVLFGEGSHNFEVALQYSIDYDFDLRIAYSLSWSNGKSTDNVILNFANRDNIIYDENYIYLANSVNAGSGKVTLLTGVEFVDPTDSTYNGAELQITIQNSDVKFYKVQPSYTASNGLISDLVETDTDGNITSYGSDAAQAWHQYKQTFTAAQDVTRDSYVMVYNYRRDFAHGVKHPGLNTAYKKPASTSTYEVKENEGTDNEKVVESYTKGTVYAPVWTGGNRSYAGAGLYVIAGTSAIELEIQVSGIWRTSSEAYLTSENNVQFNYTSDWTFERYSKDAEGEDKGLWDVRSFNFSIPAKTACYIDILDSIEITSAGKDSTTDYTNYRLVTNAITINPASENKTEFTYNESTAEYIKFSSIESVESTKTEYTKDAVSVVNTTTYSNGLFSSFSAAQTTYDGNITLINNTGVTQLVDISLGLKYHISNGAVNLYADEAKTRAIDYIDRKNQYTYTQAFNNVEGNTTVSTLYYSYTGTATSHLASVNNLAVASEYSIMLAPYSSANLLSSYTIKATLRDSLLTMFNDSGTSLRDEYYDVWTYVEPTSMSSVEIPEDISLETVKANLMLEAKQTESGTTISVKNNTNTTITGISVSEFAVRTYSEAQSAKLASQPADWEAVYWKYYKNGTPLTSLPQTFEKDTYYTYSKSHTLTTASYTLLNSFAFGTKTVTVDNGEGGTTTSTVTDTTKISNADQVLLPGESVEIITYSTTAKLILSGVATTTKSSTETDLTIINNGTANAYIVNYSENSYYLRLAGSHTGTNFETISGYSYYIGIVRPGQIINLSSMSAKVTIAETDKIEIDEENSNYSSTILGSWNTDAIARFDDYFNIEK